MPRHAQGYRSCACIIGKSKTECKRAKRFKVGDGVQQLDKGSQNRSIFLHSRLDKRVTASVHPLSQPLQRNVLVL